MKKFLIEWETDYCDSFPEQWGQEIIEAENEDEAIQKFNDLKIRKACIGFVGEVA